MRRSYLAAIILMCIGIACAGCAPPENAPDTETRTEIPKETQPEQPWDQWAERYPSWVEPTKPFQIAGNLYHVGTKGLASFLITTDEGHILVDGGMPQNAPIIAANIEAIGFNLHDVKILLNSHAHFDHSGGLAELKEKTGARLIAHSGDVSALEGGFYLGAEDKPEYSAPPVKVDQVIEDGHIVELGDMALKANLTPGHTRGCTSWSFPLTDGGQDYEVLMFCSATVAGNRLVPPQYDGIIEDYRETFEKTKDWRPDIPLGFHPGFFNFWEKREAQLSGTANSYVDRDSFPKLMNNLQDRFEKELALQSSKKPAP